MSGLKLGDITLDPRRAVYVSSLRAVVCSGVISGLQCGISDGLRGVIERIDCLHADYAPEYFVVLGAGGAARGGRESGVEAFDAALSALSRRWGGLAKIQLVVSGLDRTKSALAEAAGCEVHSELIWGRYRFVERDDSSRLDLALTTISGGPHHWIRVGGRAFGGMKLPVFLKGVGRLTLPSSDPTAAGTNVLRGTPDRSDVFAAGHQRVLPLGKVADVKTAKGIARGLPVSRSTLGVKPTAQEAPSAD